MHNKVEETLFEKRIIKLWDEINDDNTQRIISSLKYLDFLDHTPIQLWIHSNGGDVRCGMAIIDVMKSLESKVETVCMGKAYSMAALILTCGDQRKALKHSHIMIHEPKVYKNQKGEKETDIKVQLEEMQRVKKEVIQLLCTHTKQNKEIIENDLSIDFYMNSKEAMEYGIIDKIVGE